MIAVINRPFQFFRQFFSCLHPDQTLGLAEAAIKLDLVDFVQRRDVRQ